MKVQEPQVSTSCRVGTPLREGCSDDPCVFHPYGRYATRTPSPLIRLLERCNFACLGEISRLLLTLNILECIFVPSDDGTCICPHLCIRRPSVALEYRLLLWTQTHFFVDRADVRRMTSTNGMIISIPAVSRCLRSRLPTSYNEHQTQNPRPQIPNPKS